MLTLLPRTGLWAHADESDDAGDEKRGAQLEYLESLIEYYSVTEPENIDVLLGRLILRDDDPEHSAKHVLKHAEPSTVVVAREAIRCPKCRPLLDVILGVARPPPQLQARDTHLSRALREKARRMLDDGHGYIRRFSPRDHDLLTARALLGSAVEDAPTDWESLHLYGVVNDLSDNEDDAEAAFRKAVNVHPRSTWMYNNLAVFYLRHQLTRHAYYILRVARETGESNHRTARLLAWLHREPETSALVSRPEAIELMEEVVRREESREKRLRDEQYLAWLIDRWESERRTGAPR